ncbi:MAG: xanthine phosphoribosyltransferase, partial [Geminicoccaceae bacterium]|nr:xanthine phosphoribosyltransferase [Geminicoccaceae bacterium]
MSLSWPSLGERRPVLKCAFFRPPAKHGIRIPVHSVTGPPSFLTSAIPVASFRQAPPEVRIPAITRKIRVSETYTRYFPVSWEELHRDAKALSWRLASGGPWKGIIAITRGGLVPAHIISRELEIRIIDTVCISTYDDTKQREPEILKAKQGQSDGEGWLIIDDLVDTGQTGRIVREML